MKVSKYGVSSCPNAVKYGPAKTPYLDTFQKNTLPKKIVQNAFVQEAALNICQGMNEADINKK